MMAKNRRRLIAAMFTFGLAALSVSFYVPTRGAVKAEVGAGPDAWLFQPATPLAAAATAAPADIIWICPDTVTIGVANTPAGWTNNLLLSQFAKFKKISMDSNGKREKVITCIYSNDEGTYGFSRTLSASYTCTVNATDTSGKTVMCKLHVPK